MSTDHFKHGHCPSYQSSNSASMSDEPWANYEAWNIYTFTYEHYGALDPASYFKLGPRAIETIHLCERKHKTQDSAKDDRRIVYRGTYSTPLLHGTWTMQPFSGVVPSPPGEPQPPHEFTLRFHYSGSNDKAQAHKFVRVVPDEDSGHLAPTTWIHVGRSGTWFTAGHPFHANQVVSKIVMLKLIKQDDYQNEEAYNNAIMGLTNQPHGVRPSPDNRFHPYLG